MQTYHSLIEINPKIMLGKPVIKGTRITVQQLLESLATGTSMEELLAMHPHISRQQILAALQFASDEIGSISSFPIPLAA